MLTPWHPSKFQALENHPLTKIAKEQLPDYDPILYLCTVTGYFGIGFFLDDNPHTIWPDAARGTRVFKELVSLGTDLNKVGREKIVELRQRMRFNAKEAGKLLRSVEARKLEERQEVETENQSIREWLTQVSGKASPTSLWNRNRIKFSFAGRGGRRQKARAGSPSFSTLG